MIIKNEPRWGASYHSSYYCPVRGVINCYVEISIVDGSHIYTYVLKGDHKEEISKIETVEEIKNYVRNNKRWLTTLSDPIE